MKDKKSGLSESFVAGVIAIVFLLVGFQTALFIHRAAVMKIVSNRDEPDTVYVYETDRIAVTSDSPSQSVVRKSTVHSPAAESVRRNQSRKRVENFMFDPNTVTVDDLCRLGFSLKQAQAIDNYRRKGGRFRRKADFAESFVVSDSIYRRLEPYIDIPLTDLNVADSSAFDALPGIGGWFASKIIEHRTALGGFSYKEQRDFETIEDTVMQLETRLEELAAQIEESAADYVKVTSLMDEQTVTQQKLDEVGYPKMEIVSVGKEGFTFKAIVSVRPEVKLGTYKGLTAPKEAAKVTEKDVNEELKPYIDRATRLVAVKRKAKKGDTAVIDFEGFKDGVAFDGGKGENYNLALGSGTFVPGFEEQVIGMKAGEEKDIDITFPEDYHKELAGKAVVFHVKCNKVTTTILPELDDEFAKDVSEFDTLEALTADIRAKALENAQKQIDSAFEQAVVDKAAENTTVDMPAALIEAELDNQMERFAYQLQMSGYSVEQYAKMMGGDLNTMRSAFRPAAEKQAKVNVTLEKIIEVEGITVTDEDVEAEYAAVAAQYSLELDKVKSMVPVEEIQTSLKTRKAVKVIVDSAKAKKPAKAKKTTTKKTTTKKTAKTAEKEETPVEE